MYAKTVLGGTTILADTVWTKESSPYLLTGDVTITGGVTLTLLEGVEVLFLANSDDQSSGQRIGDAELLVNGSLNAVGSAELPVLFGSSEAEGKPGDWGGIYVQNGSLSLSHVEMAHSGYGVSVDGGNGVGVADSKLVQNGAGFTLAVAVKSLLIVMRLRLYREIGLYKLIISTQMILALLIIRSSH